MADDQRLPDHAAGGYTIYALTEPDTDEVRYIGRTGNAKNRYETHCRAHSGMKNDALYEWLLAFRAAGTKPGFKILIRITGPCSSLVAKQAEMQMIGWWSRQHPGRLLQTAGIMEPYGGIKHEKRFSLNGKTQSMAGWGRDLGISRERVRQRLLKYPPEVALTAPKAPNGTNVKLS